MGRPARNPAAMIPKFGYAVNCQELSKAFGSKAWSGHDGFAIGQVEAWEELSVGNRLAASLLSPVTTPPYSTQVHVHVLVPIHVHVLVHIYVLVHTYVRVLVHAYFYVHVHACSCPYSLPSQLQPLNCKQRTEHSVSAA
jgi:hypothetical protein